MVINLGEAKASALISSNTLSSRPCPITEQDTEELKEYKVFHDSGEATSSKHNSTKVEVNEDDVKNHDEAMDVLKVAGTCLPGGAGLLPAQIKAEKADPQDKIDVEWKKIIDKPTAVINQINTQLLEAESYIEQSANNRYAAPLKEDLGKLMPKMRKVLKAMNQVALSEGKSMNKEAIYKLMKDKEVTDTTWADLRPWALRLGLKGLGSASKGSKRSRGS